MKKWNKLPEELRKAYEELQKLNANEAEREIAERRYMDLLSIEYGKHYEREAGKKETKIEIAKKMKRDNESVEKIIEYTGLTKEEIESI